MSPTKKTRKTIKSSGKSSGSKKILKKKTGGKTLKKTVRKTAAGGAAKKTSAREPAASAKKPARPKAALKPEQARTALPKTRLPKRGRKEKQADPSRGKALAVAVAALDKKALDLIVLQVTELVSYTDYFVICTASSRPHVQAVADNVGETLRKAGVRPLGVEGRTHAHWVLMDYGDVVLHVMDPEARAYYGLEKLWLDAPRVSIDADQAFVGGQDKAAVGCGCG